MKPLHENLVFLFSRIKEIFLCVDNPEFLKYKDSVLKKFLINSSLTKLRYKIGAFDIVWGFLIMKKKDIL